VSLTLPIPEQFSFPPACPCCMNFINKDTSGVDLIRADEHPLGFLLEALSGKRMAPISVPYCRPCLQHIKLYRTPDSWGCFAVLLVTGSIFVGTKATLWAGIAAFILPLVLFFVIGRPRRIRRAETRRLATCCKAGPSVNFSGLSTFVFENDIYGTLFVEFNGFRN